jgi:hypothetical protein
MPLHPAGRDRGEADAATEAGPIDKDRIDMADETRPAWELEQDARTINATDWQPPPGMAKKRRSQCRYWFAVPIGEAEAISLRAQSLRPPR